MRLWNQGGFTTRSVVSTLINPYITRQDETFDSQTVNICFEIIFNINSNPDTCLAQTKITVIIWI